MLVLVSFGLVLLATILLVVGLLSDDGITLIYLSIAASATAAVVLFLAFRMARPKGATGSSEPAPLPADLQPSEPEEAPAVEAAPPAPPTTPVPAAVPAATEDAWADDADWEVDDDELVDFPIADYDDLTVAEILPLLPQLYSDELDIVYEREQNGKARATILGELDRLKQTGTEADALEQGVAAPAPEPEPAPAPAPPVTTPASSLLDDDDEFDAAFFPIADYDDLSVSQIVPLLPQLEEDELRDVRDREVAGANRATLVAEIDRYLSGELETFTWEDDAPVEAPAPVVDPEVARLPIADYPQLVVSEVVAQLDGLTPAQLEQVLEFEKARDNRFGIVADIERRLDEAAPATATRPRQSAPKRTAARATTRKATAKKGATKKAAARKSSTRKASTKKAAARKATTKKAAKRSTKSTKKATAARFPIAKYDELNVADIRPRLADLTDAQLRQVRDREQTGAGRKTILNDIDKRLS